MMNWIDDIIEKVLQNYNGRKIVIWGYNRASKDIVRVLQSHDVQFGFFIEDEVNSIDGRVVREFSEIAGKFDDYYLVVTMGYYADRKALIERGVYTRQRLLLFL